MPLSRRRFVQGAVSTGFLGLSRLVQAQGRAGGTGAQQAPPEPQPYWNEVDGYGPLVPDPLRILDLPRGFRYRVLSHTGDAMSDGLLVPGAPDGMAAFPGPNGRVILVRNHELNSDTPNTGAFGWTNERLAKMDPRLIYDRGKEKQLPYLGGTTTLVYDPASGKVEQQFLSLAGTARNCAGGPTPWNSWLTCEEDVNIASDPTVNCAVDHGYVFEVPASPTPKLTPPVPLKAMGRFYHEAAAVDPRTGIVYMSEDRVDGLLYRFIPSQRGNLAAGGRLQALAVRDRKTFDTRNFAETGAPKLAVGQPVAVQWIDLANVDTQRDDLRTRGADAGAALFARGEGLWFGSNELYLCCTNGGISQRGQIFRYRPEREELQLFIEPNNAQMLESCDNVSVAPWGDLFVCEDNAAPAATVVRQTASNYIRAVTPAGKMYTFARNHYSSGTSELSGLCFAPNHPTMFLNIQVPGFTVAITGPWDSARR